LGHFFIYEHRNALKKGKSLHKSYYRFLRKNIVEIEADHFASNLLMPTSRFKQSALVRKFDFSVIELIESLTSKFGTSLSATLLKFIEVGMHPIMVVFSRNNLIEQCWKFEGKILYKLTDVLQMLENNYFDVWKKKRL
jgi:Zn-dependent peptidase ImmA (M78 family)